MVRKRSIPKNTHERDINQEVRKRPEERGLGWWYRWTQKGASDKNYQSRMCVELLGTVLWVVLCSSLSLSSFAIMCKYLLFKI